MLCKPLLFLFVRRILVFRQCGSPFYLNSPCEGEGGGNLKRDASRFHTKLLVCLFVVLWCGIRNIYVWSILQWTVIYALIHTTLQTTRRFHFQKLSTSPLYYQFSLEGYRKGTSLIRGTKFCMRKACSFFWVGEWWGKMVSYVELVVDSKSKVFHFLGACIGGGEGAVGHEKLQI